MRLINMMKMTLSLIERNTNNTTVDNTKVVKPVIKE